MDQPARPGDSPTVIVWRRNWLPGTETFVRNQISALTKWRAQPTGIGRIESPTTSPSDFVRREQFRDSPIPLVGRFVTAFACMLLSRRQLTSRLQSTGHVASVLHAHFVTDALYVVPAAKRRNLGTVVTAHGFDVTSWPQALNAPRALRTFVQRYRRARIRHLIRYTDRFIAVSDFVRERLVALGVPEQQITVAYIGIPLSSETLVMPSKSSRSVLFVGRLNQQKGIADLIDAWAMLPDELNDAQLTVVGDGPLREDLENRARACRANIQFVGFLPSQEVRSLMRCSEIFCGPSKTGPAGNTEAFGLVFLEAAAEGCATISYRSGGVPEAVVDGETGVLCDEGDIVQLSKSLTELLLNDALRVRLATMGKMRVTREFDIRTRTLTLEDIYDRAARSSAAATSAG